TITTPTTGSFAQGSAESDYDTYVQLRKVAYVNAHVGADFSADTRFDATFNYGYGHYRQYTDEDQFLQATSPNLAFNYDLNTTTAPLFTPVNLARFMDPNFYTMAYHLLATDQSHSNLPQAKVDFSHNFDAEDRGFGFELGATGRWLSQVYSYNQYRWNPVGAAPTLATVGTINKNINLYNGYGQTLLLVDKGAVNAYVANHGSGFAENASDSLSNTVNNYALKENITAGYGQVSYRTDALSIIAGVRIEGTDETIVNNLPV